MSASAVSTVSPSRPAKCADDLAALLLEASDAPAEADPFLAQHRTRRLEQDHLQLAAMDRELRPRQSGMAAARVGPDRLAVPVGVAQLARLDAGCRQRRLEPEACEDPNGAGLDVDADAERLELGHRFEHLDVEARALQAHGRREAADARAGDHDLHDVKRSRLSRDRAGLPMVGRPALGVAVGELAQIGPAVDAGIVPVVENDADGVVADRLDVDDVHVPAAADDLLLARPMSLHLGRRALDAQVLGRQRKGAAIGELDLERASSLMSRSSVGQGVLADFVAAFVGHRLWRSRPSPSWHVPEGPRLAHQHDRNAVADGIGEPGLAADQLAGRRIILQRPVGRRADQDFQQLRIDAAAARRRERRNDWKRRLMAG